jgi:hypothetical protein
MESCVVEGTPGLGLFVIVCLGLSVFEVLMTGVYPRSLLGLGFLLIFLVPFAAALQVGWTRAESWFDQTSLGRRAAGEAEGNLGSGTRALVVLLVFLAVGGTLYVGSVMVQRWVGIGGFLGKHFGHWRLF